LHSVRSFLWVAATALYAGAAAAHAPPEATGILWSPNGSHERTVVRTNRGLIVSEDAGRTFRLLCNDAFGASLTEVAPVVATSTGRLLIASYLSGLLAASSDLCTFTPVPGPLGAPTNVVGIERAASTPLELFAILSRDGSTDHLFTSADDGVTWRAPSHVEDFSFTLAIAPSDPKRLYVTALHAADGGASTYRLMASGDGGRTLVAHDVALDPTESGLSVLGVDPSEPERVFARTTASDPTLPARLLRSDDGGKSLVNVMTLVAPKSVAMSPDGATVWVGGQDGVFRSTDHGKTFTRIASAGVTQVACLAVHEGRLFACGYANDAFGVLVSSDAGDSFSSFLRFPDVKEPLDCSPETMSGRACATRFEDWRIEQGLAGAGGNGGQAGAGNGAQGGVPSTGGTTPVPATGGAPTAPTTGGAGGVPPANDAKSGCGCRTVGARTADTAARFDALAALLVLTPLLRAARRR
jgi:hypothetical protein